MVGFIHSQTAAAHNTSPFQQKTPKSAPKFKDEPTADYQTFSKQQTPKPQILSDSDNEFYRQQALINQGSAVTPTKSQIIHNRNQSNKLGRDQSKSPKPISKEYTAETEVEIPQTDDSAFPQQIFSKPKQLNQQQSPKLLF